MAPQEACHLLSSRPELFLPTKRMNCSLCRVLLVSFVFLVGSGLVAMAQEASPLHPLDSLTTAEYWTTYDVLKQAGHVDADTFFASVFLREPAKDVVLAWKEGSAIPIPHGV